MTRFGTFAAGMTACLLLSGCQSVYLHDEGLKTSTAKAHEALAGVTPLKPFDDQLANLEAFAQREDLAAAEFWAGVRDKHFNAYLSLGEDGRIDFMGKYIWARLPALTTDTDPLSLNGLPSLPAILTRAWEGKANAEEQAEHWRRAYLERWSELEGPKQKQERAEAKRAAGRTGDGGEEKEEPKKPDLRCKAVLADTTSEADGELRALRNEIRANCLTIADQEKIIAAKRKSLEEAGGEIGEAAIQAIDIEAETKVELSERGQEIEAVIKAAAKADKASAQAGLLALRAKIRELLGKVDDAQQAAAEAPGAGSLLAGWEEADQTIDALLRAEICDAPDGAVDKPTKDAAKCPDIAAPTTTGRAQAAWAMMKALAQLQDAGDEARRSANWLLAAKAIIGAERADAALKLQEAKARSAVARQRLDALVAEAGGLIKAQKWLSASGNPKPDHKDFGDCEYDLTVSRPANSHCAFAFYADAWNRGRVPAEMLKYRPIQLDREYGVRRSRAVAEKQYALARAGVATLKEYGEGGIMPETIAQMILDLGTMGVIRLED